MNKMVFLLSLLFLFVSLAPIEKVSHANAMPCETFEPNCSGEGGDEEGEDEPERPEDPEGPDTVGEGI